METYLQLLDLREVDRHKAEVEIQKKVAERAALQRQDTQNRRMRKGRRR
jgi:hypothetical protein